MISPTSKRRSHYDALLELLSDNREHSMEECQRVGGWRYGARIHEMRRKGMIIDTIQKGVDVFAYRLIPEGQLALQV